MEPEDMDLARELVRILRFETAAEREGYLAERLAQRRAMDAERDKWIAERGRRARR